MISSLLNKLHLFLPKNRFARGVAVLAGSAALGQGIVILASPLLTRLYSPGDFGTLALYTAFLSIAAVTVSLRYELAIPIPEDDGQAANLVALALSLVVGLSALSAVAIGTLPKSIFTTLRLEALVPYLWFLPFGILLIGCYQILNYWAVRQKAFSSIAKTKLSQGSGSAFTQLGLGLASLGTFGLIIGHIVGQTAGSTMLAREAWSSSSPLFKKVNFKDMAFVANRYRKFPFFSLGSGLANVFSMHMVVLLLTFFYNPVVTGLYALGQRIIQTPMGLVSSSVSQVLYREMVEAFNDNTLHRLVVQTYQKLTLFAILPFSIMMIAAPQIFVIVFGETWREAGEYTRALIPWLFLMFLNSPMTNLISVLEKQRSYLIYDLSLLASRVAAICLSALFIGNPLVSIALYGGVGFVFNLWLVFYLLRLSRVARVA